MIRHLLALTWNRRRTNLLLMIEIFVAFLALVALTTLGFWGWSAYHEPVGYSVQDVWRVRITRHEVLPNLPKKTSLGSLNIPTGGTRKPTAKGPPPDTRQVAATVAALPQVLAVAAMDGSTPYSGWRSRRGSRINGRKYYLGTASDNLPAVLGIQLSRGRWFGKQDDGAAYTPVVITEQMARAHFGDADPLGRTLQDDLDREAPTAPRRVMRVVGVVPQYVTENPFKGQFGGRRDFLFDRLTPQPPVEDPFLPVLLVKTRPGITAAFEEPLMKTIQAAAPGWHVEATAYELGRTQMLDQALTLFYALAVMGGFLLLMVTLGLSGVVWQNVTQRTAEIGLRRAQGATAGDIRRQFLGELAALATVAMAAGAVVVVHFAGIVANLSYFAIGWVTWDVYAVGFALAAGSIYVLVMLAGFFPAQLATRIQPLAALRQE